MLLYTIPYKKKNIVRCATKMNAIAGWTYKSTVFATLFILCKLFTSITWRSSGKRYGGHNFYILYNNFQEKNVIFSLLSYCSCSINYTTKEKKLNSCQISDLIFVFVCLLDHFWSKPE